MTLAAGTKIGRLELRELIGAGGMGEVYRANDPVLRRHVAIKIIPADFAADAMRVQRFEDEARAAASLNHPNIIAVHDVGTESGLPYIVTELLEGSSLRERLRTGPLPVRKAIDYAIQMARGLAAAHGRGIIHRDLKPDNVFITSDGRLKILDFGVAKLKQTEWGGDDSTRTVAPGTSTIVGTIGYMAPEQIRASPVDARTDLFAFGAVLYEMLSGNRAFQGATAADTITAILTRDPPELMQAEGSIPVPLERIVRRCLEKNPDERFQSATDLSFALEGVSSASGEVTRRAAPQLEKRQWLTRMAALAATVLAAAGLFAAAYRLFSGSEPPTYSQVTYNRGYIPVARFSPDGQTVTFAAAWPAPPMKLYSVRADGKELRALELPASMLLSVSRTGELAIALDPFGRAAWGVGSRLARAPASGGAARELLDDVVAADWSADGQLAVARTLNGKCRLEYPMGKVIYENTGYISHMRFSPNGDAIAFMDHPLPGDDRGTVKWVDLKGNVRTLTQEWEGEEGLAWAPKSNEIWFTATPAGEHRTLFGVSDRGKQRTILRIPGSLHLEDIAANGRVLLTARDFRYEVFALEPGGDRQLSWSEIMIGASISADGNSVIIDDLSSPESDYRVYLAKLDGSPAVFLGTGAATPGSVSRDGKWVATILPTRMNVVQLLPTGVGETRTVSAPNMHYRSAAWSADGKALIVRANESDHAARFWLQPLDGSTPTPITPEGVDGFPLNFANSDYVVARDVSGAAQLYPVGGGAPAAAKGFAEHDEILATTPGSEWVYVTPNPYALPFQIWKVNVRTGERRQVTTISPTDRVGVLRVLSPLVSPDEKHIIYTQVRNLSSLYVADNLK